MYQNGQKSTIMIILLNLMFLNPNDSVSKSLNSSSPQNNDVQTINYNAIEINMTSTIIND